MRLAIERQFGSRDTRRLLRLVERGGLSAQNVQLRRRPEDEKRASGESGGLSGTRARVEHKEYGSALMVTWDDANKNWYVVDYNPAVDKNQLTKEFSVRDFVLL